jgi:copper chaperone CopZ
MLAGLCGLVLLAGAARAEEKVEIKKVHLCCPACVKTVGGILEKIDGVKGECDRDKKTVTFTAPDAKAAQKVIDALAAAGFHGDTGSKTITFKDDSGVKKGKVKELTLEGAHNCCPQCCRAIKATVKKVDGVKEDDAEPKGKSFTVKGDFDAAALVKALHDAGFHVKAKK